MISEAILAELFPANLPYNPMRKSMYSADELMEGHQNGLDNSLDRRIQRHFIDQGRHRPNFREGLAQRVHDHAIDTALQKFMSSELNSLKIVGIMGSHKTARTDPHYRSVVKLASQLTQEGYLVSSGGGLGIMEAANLGAYLANFDSSAIETALSMLAEVPSYLGHEEDYFAVAFQVRKKYQNGAQNLAIPTWVYDAEPVSPFASHIAKYFANSIREDGLLAIAVHGIVFAPGGSGTLQEIFQDAAQNSYWALGSQSPMVFLGCDHHKAPPSIYDLIYARAQEGEFADLVHLTDDISKVISFLKENGPRIKQEPI